MNAAIVRLCGDTTPGCYMNAVVELAASKLQLGDILKQSPISRRKTALHAAAFPGNAELVMYLSSRGADVDAQDGLTEGKKYW
ncbi:hypothetical protein M419DRAFT_12646 [Trichoderma reesei RUT C-30]|uniref:Uncharacterized protein n=1 Tax=Hypocrea jecorina (strain ATCC 56765 / BCRC 32924 / NRRL 11460 / Rut C-30) TaxID=1344414 RepID=A0A024RXC3_HYPJR|nr:hypothetical protein M419DRAFT_12646 [Trichoderma reesei RUT C-30]